MIRLRSHAAVFFAAILTALLTSAHPTAHAQIFSAYIESNNTRFDNVGTGIVYTPVTGAYASQYTSFWASGVGGGATLNFLPLGPVHVGLDFRGSTRTGTVGADTGMLGIRLGIKVPVIKIKPYIQASGGYIATRTANIGNISNGSSLSSTVGGPYTNQYAGYEIFGGIDYPLVPFVDFRVIEIGGGTAYTVGGSTLSTYSIQSITLFSVNTGLVVHF